MIDPIVKRYQKEEAVRKDLVEADDKSKSNIVLT